MTKELITLTAMLRVPRSRGALSGVLLVLLGLWGGLAALAGPYFHFAFAPDTAWEFTSGRIMLQVAPAGAAVVGGLVVVASANRVLATIGAWIAAFGGAWFVVGAPLSALWTDPGSAPLGPAVGDRTRQVLEQVGLLSGLGTVIVFVAALAIGRLAVVGVKDARLAERLAQDEADALAAETTQVDLPRPQQLVSSAAKAPDQKVAGTSTKEYPTSRKT
jgi:hypothetical protein